MTAASMLSLVAASWIAAEGGRPGIGWGVFCSAAGALGFIYNWPTALALCSPGRPRPARFRSRRASVRTRIRHGRGDGPAMSG